MRAIARAIACVCVCVCVYVYRMSTSGEISSVQLRKGLGRVRDSLEDLQLDNPAAKEQHAAVMEVRGVSHTHTHTHTHAHTYKLETAPVAAPGMGQAAREANGLTCILQWANVIQTAGRGAQVSDVVIQASNADIPRLCVY